MVVQKVIKQEVSFYGGGAMDLIASKVNEPFIPQDVALMVIRGNMPLVKAWRLRLNMTVEEIAAAAGMLPNEVTGFEQRENVFSRPLLNVARAMNLDVEQIVDISN